MKALIVSGGTPPTEDIFLQEVKTCDILIGADKGCETYFKYNFIPDYALGDFDSINDFYKEKLKLTNVIKYNSEKDNTDSEIALLKAIELNADEICILGVTGSRIDHVLGSLGLLNIALENNVECYIKDKNNIIILTNKDISLKDKGYKYISFQAFGENIRSFSIKGAKYEVNNCLLSFGDGKFISNEFLNSEDINIKFQNGKILIIYSKD
ncbi:MAG: thiamine diphosphokinase [Clostridium perfringens]|nr:thiamine diphosphokinase [Clostridium perfringens]